MNVEEVKARWPKETSIAERHLAEGGSVIPAIKAMRKLTGISLLDSKRVIVAVQQGVSVEEYQEELIPGIEAAFKQEHDQTQQGGSSDSVAGAPESEAR